ncbi:hypothetical protein D3C84_1121910 [compost metagenome]
MHVIGFTHLFTKCDNPQRELRIEDTHQTRIVEGFEQREVAVVTLQEVHVDVTLNPWDQVLFTFLDLFLVVPQDLMVF